MGQPTVTPIVERRHAWGFVVLELQDGAFSRAPIILAAGAGICTAGLVLGQIAHALSGTGAALGANTGNPTFGAITAADPAIAGLYVLNMEDATHFTVEDPNGVEVGHGTLGQAFAGGGLGFTLTAGGTACAPGDSFRITVAVGSGKFVPYDPTGNDGREVAAAILGNEYRDATSVDKVATGLVRGPAKVQSAELVWGANVDDAHKAVALAQLAALGILSVYGPPSI